ncbi:MAG: excinuclease ABC subunit UvrA [Ignavibacteriales bacterium]|nr:excinuclease ABC subunit UvrA [Ignavibacteriales bacterium]
MIQIKASKDEKRIIIKGAREHNLKNLDLEIPRNKLVVVTGVSGSGKSSLVFDTIYAEGQRRYVESLSSYARQFLERMNKPDVDMILGISPAVAIEQKTGSKNSRSTVGTTTEIYDYLRLFFARVGKTICFVCGKEVKKASTGVVCDWLEEQAEGSRWLMGFPVHGHEGRTLEDEIALLKRRGFFRVYAAGKLIDLNEEACPEVEKKDVCVITERIKVSKGKIRDKLADSIEGSFKEGEGRVVVIDAESGARSDFNTFYECCNVRYEEPEPRFFSFNNPFGACPVCQGFSKIIGIDEDLVVPNPYLSLVDGALAPFRTPGYASHARALLRSAQKKKIPVDVPYIELTEEQKALIRKGFYDFIGTDKFFKQLEEHAYKITARVLLSKYRGYTKCSACKGSRLRRESLQVKIAGKDISELTSMTIAKAHGFFKSITFTQYELAIADRIIKELIKRLTYLNDVGLGYLTLDRISSTLSGGETQRINLATALGSALVGTLYVLDEPSIGLHPRDTTKLINILKNLRDIGNSVLVVEHDPDMMRESDLIIDIGPKAGKEGGNIVFMGTFADIMAGKSKSLTGQYLSRKKVIPLPEKRNTEKTKHITIKGAREHNLKNVTVEIPQQKFVCITGVSGSGKSTLVHEILYSGIAKNLGMAPAEIGKFEDITGIENIKQVEIVDQSPIGKSPRSNPASYIKVYEIIRELFALTHQAKARGFKPGYFSFNVPGGRCETCQGDGFIKVEMQFLADIYLECEECKGSRFKKEIHDIMYRGQNMVDVLKMTVDEALPFFHGHDKILKYLQVLSDVGLGYVQLGQPSNTLSGGEAQRIKLASHLTQQKDNVHTLFIFDEPTTGLHFDDIAKLLNCFRMLLQKNNSLVVIEHNLEVIKCADYVIDMGPEAGDEGGTVAACGTPEEIAANPDSWTGKYLKEVL